jgi:hypothetical protein
MGKPRRMTAGDWDSCCYPGSMLPHLRTGSARTLRLFVCACLRRVWPLLSDPHSRRAVEAAELWADGLLADKQLAQARQAAEAAERARGPVSYWAARGATQAALPRNDWVVNTAWCAVMAVCRGPQQRQEEEQSQCALVRDIFANPFRPTPAVGPARLAWNDGTVVKLAQAAYDDRDLPAGTLDNIRLAVLADALEEAGLQDAGLLAHLRSAGPHVRGCFALDAVLGRS